MDVSYCPKCATELIVRLDGDRQRPTCPACGFVFYFNPVVGAGTLVETEGRVVLVYRSMEPQAGYWSLPSGYVEADELAEEAAVRETWEETGLEVEIDEMLGVYSFGREAQTGVLLLYAAHVTGGELRAGDDAGEVRTFAPDELPPNDQIAFRTHLRALDDWRRTRAIVYRQAGVDDRPAVIEFAEQFPEVGKQSVSYLEERERAVLLAIDRDQLVGVACLSYRPWSHTISIDQIFVRPNYRRWGIGTKLVEGTISYARAQGMRSLFVEIAVGNPAVLVYLKAGFRVAGFTDIHFQVGRQQAVSALVLAYDFG
ncbi:MAG: GNAT family N-acetyltransferase [Anaerolineae bacterium]